ncbi:hypothetical protein PX701_12660 [Agromyces sp. H3Y2-19a]|uniref:hypothetical protein n=1 Tax=Agromyces chromiiresistens TaxID=3030835 RepID=UPI0023B9E26C|nr:hypothetical protein [Agromyces chromiiresistens]MDF0514475.1 hypothetical protein [Agromyces chromiiresistens]
MTSLLGGDASPVGWCVQFVDAPFETTLAAHLAWRRSLPAGTPITVSKPMPFARALQNLTPFETPWTRELFVPLDGWTAYLNNGIGGGDPSASAYVTANALGVRHIVAMNSPTHGPGHSSTQLWLSGPGGAPPSMSIRTISAHQQDGRWSWLETGALQSFEDADRYTRRRVRDRFDREALLSCLAALGIDLAEDARWGDGVVVQQRVPWPRRTVTWDEARAEV